MRVHRLRAVRRGLRDGRVLIAALSMTAALAGLGCGPALRAASASGADRAPVQPLKSHQALALAREALVSKDLAKALHYYEIALENNPKPDDRRAEALFGTGMLMMDTDPGVRDIARGRARMEELEKLYPGVSFRAGAITVLDLVAESDRLRSEAQKLRDEGKKAEESWKQEKETLLEQSLAAAKETQNSRDEAARQNRVADGLREELAGREAELYKLRADLVAKDEAIKKAFRNVKGAFVRQGASGVVSTAGGKTGSADKTGSTGGAGSTGSTGGAGSTGSTGGAGSTGNTGSTGNSGGTGSTGGTGATGNTGRAEGAGSRGKESRR